MKISDWIPYFILGALIIIYFIGEATGLLFFAFLIIAPVWAWIVTEPTQKDS